jgi:predicted nucleic-acid-binding Zn-ribbon protein
MGLDEGQKQKLREWLQSKSAQPTCASCGRDEWGAGEIVSAPILDEKGNVLSDSHVPMVQLICTNCGHIIFYAAVPLGLA